MAANIGSSDAVQNAKATAVNPVERIQSILSGQIANNALPSDNGLMSYKLIADAKKYAKDNEDTNLGKLLKNEMAYVDVAMHAINNNDRLKHLLGGASMANALGLAEFLKAEAQREEVRELLQPYSNQIIKQLNVKPPPEPDFKNSEN